MKTKFKFIFMLILVLNVSDKAFSELVNNSARIFVSSGTYLVVNGNYTSQGSGAASGEGVIDLKGNLVNNNTAGNPVSTTGTVTFSGSAQQQISGNSLIFENVALSNSNGLLMGCDASVGGTLTLSTGNMDLNGHNVVLDADATLAETGGRVLGSGSISTTRSLSNIDENVAGLGAQITTAADMGSTVISRGHAVQTGSGNESILRYYDITPTNNSGLNATLVFHYDDSELNGRTESDLVLYRSEDAGTNWVEAGGTVDAESNTITLASIAAFSRWTAGGTGDQALPVELTSFTARAGDGQVTLCWVTESEINNDAFLLERSTDGESFELLAEIEGHGTVSFRNEYEYVDYQV